MAIDKYKYPYVITQLVTIHQTFPANTNPQDKIAFFDKYKEDRDMFRRWPEKVQERVTVDLVHKHYLHLHPVEEIDKSKSYYIISKIGQGSFGQVFLIKNPKKNEIFALKRVSLGNQIPQDPDRDQKCYKIHLSRLKQFQKDLDINKLDDSNPSGDPNNPMREIKTLRMVENCDYPKKFIKLHKFDLKKEKDAKNEDKYFCYLTLDFFGGVDFKKSSVFEYFLNLKDFTDLGNDDTTVSRITSKIFMDLVNITE